MAGVLGMSTVAAAEGGDGAAGTMHALLEKTIFNIDVLRIEVQPDDATAREIDALVRGGSYTPALAVEIAGKAVRASGALIRIKFERSVSRSQFADGVGENLERAGRAGWLDRATVAWTRSQMGPWFAPLGDRGFRKGDELGYRIGRDSVRTTLVSRDGQMLLDSTTTEPQGRAALLAGYFAPGTDLRDQLVRSLFEPRPQPAARGPVSATPQPGSKTR